MQFSMACKYGDIDAIGIEVAQQIKLSGCPTKGHFTDKRVKNAFFPLLRRFGKFFGGQSQKLSDI